MSLRLLALGLALACAGTARAQDATAELALGREARAAGDHEGALAHFSRSWDLEASATSRIEMGLEALALRRFVVAEAHLTEALALAGLAELGELRALADAGLVDAARHLGSLDVHAPAGAEVRVDGATVGIAPLGRLVRVVGGAHALEGLLADHAPATTSVEVTPGAATRVELAPTLIDRRPILERVGPESLRTLGVVGLSIGGVALAVGGVMVGFAVDRASSVARACNAAPPEPSCGGLRADHELFRTAAFATLIGGTVLAVVGAVFLAISPEDANPSVACGPAFELGLACSTAF